VEKHSFSFLLTLAKNCGIKTLNWRPIFGMQQIFREQV